ncbi:hypothetical protein AUJ62_00550, partial [Candidatus Pacearchaeota archaeon CG1_02_32_21]
AGIGHITRVLRITRGLSKINHKKTYWIITNKCPSITKLPKNVKIIILPKIKVNKKLKDCRYAKKISQKANIWGSFIIEHVSKKGVTLFFSDLNPNGGYGELRKVFDYLKNTDIKKVIGLRDILDTKKQTKKEWLANKEGILSIKDYDKIIVFGKQEIFKDLYWDIMPVKKISFIDPIFPVKKKVTKGENIDIFAMFGGGKNSVEQINYLARILPYLSLKKTVIVTGFLFPKKSYEKLKKKYPNIQFLRWTKKAPEYISRARLTIAHCGYNSVNDVFLYSDNFLLFPRTKKGRKEQIIRAQYLKEKGYCDFISMKNKKESNVEIILTSLANRKLKKTINASKGILELDKILKNV